MALTAADFARFLPPVASPTSGAEAFSGSMRNVNAMEQGRAQNALGQAQLEQQKINQAAQIAQQQKRLALDQAKAAEATKLKDFERQKGQYGAVNEVMGSLRSQSPADVAAARAKLQAWGLDLDVGEDEADAPAPALTLDDVAIPMPPSAKGGRRVRITKDGQEIAGIGMDELIGPTQAALDQYVKSAEATKIPVTKEEMDAYMAIAGNDPVKAVEMIHKERQLRKEPPPNPLLQGESGSEGSWNIKLAEATEKYATSYRINSKMPEIRQQLSSTDKLKYLLSKAENGTFDPVADRVAFTELLKSMAGSRPTDYDQKFLEKAGGLANMAETKFNEVFNAGRMTDNFRNSVRALAEAAEARAQQLLEAEVSNAEAGLEERLRGIDPSVSDDFVENMKSSVRRTLGGSRVRQRRRPSARAGKAGASPGRERPLTPAAQSALDDLEGE